MKRICIAILIMSIVLFAGCSSKKSDPPPPPPPPQETKLGILNGSSFNIQAADWNGTSFGYIGVGQVVMKNVAPGTDHIHLLILGYWFHTAQILSLGTGDSVAWTLFDSTIVGAGRSISADTKTLGDALK